MRVRTPDSEKDCLQGRFLTADGLFDLRRISNDTSRNRHV